MVIYGYIHLHLYYRWWSYYYDYLAFAYRVLNFHDPRVEMLALIQWWRISSLRGGPLKTLCNPNPPGTQLPWQTKTDSTRCRPQFWQVFNTCNHSWLGWKMLYRTVPKPILKTHQDDNAALTLSWSIFGIGWSFVFSVFLVFWSQNDLKVWFSSIRLSLYLEYFRTIHLFWDEGARRGESGIRVFQDQRPGGSWYSADPVVRQDLQGPPSSKLNHINIYKHMNSNPTLTYHTYPYTWMYEHV